MAEECAQQCVSQLDEISLWRVIQERVTQFDGLFFIRNVLQTLDFSRLVAEKILNEFLP